MKFVGIKSIEELITKTALVSLEGIEKDFLNDFLNNLEILPDTLEAGKQTIAPPDPSVGIMGPTLEEGGASVNAGTYVTKENLISIGMNASSISSYLKEFVEKKAPEIVRDYADVFAIIEELFVTAIYTEEVQEYGFTLKEIKDDIKEYLGCNLVNLEPSKDNKSVKITMEFYC